MSIFLLLLFEIILSAGGYFYFYVYANLEYPSIEEDAFRILFLGESTTQGSEAGLGNDYPAQVEKILQQKYLNKKIRAFNKGWGGIETTAILRNLDKNMIKYRPHLVILMAGNNEHCNFGNSTFVYEKTSILKNFYLNSKIYHLINLIKDNPGLDLIIWDNENFVYTINKGGEYTPWPCQSPSKVIFNLDAMVQKVHSYGSEVWFAGYLQPDAREMVNPVLQRIAEENNITYVGNYPEVDFEIWLAGYWYLLPEARKSVNGVFKQLAEDNRVSIENYSESDIKSNLSLFSKDCWHPNKEGYRIIAEKIAEAIIREGIIDKWADQL